MTNLYDVLNVSQGATQDEIDAAYLARRRALPADDDEARQQLEAAYEVLGSAERRANYDATLDHVDSAATEVEGATAAGDTPGTMARATDATNVSAAEIPREVPEFVPPAAPRPGPAGLGDPVVFPGDDLPNGSHSSDVPMQPQHSPQPSGGPSKKLFAVLAGFIFLLIAAVAAGFGYILLSGEDGGDYPLDLPDDEYNLAAMGLAQDDMPEGIIINEPAQADLAFGRVVGEGLEFSNEEWAQLLDQANPEGKKSQLDALGRIRNHIRFFEAQPLRYGYPVQYSSQSTLFKDENSAMESIRTDCDTVRDPALTVNDIEIDEIADQSTAFYVLTPTEEVGDIIETVVCFRTGRIVHSISQQGFEGTQRLEVHLDLANKMLEHVEDTFEGDRG